MVRRFSFLPANGPDFAEEILQETLEGESDAVEMELLKQNPFLEITNGPPPKRDEKEHYVWS